MLLYVLFVAPHCILLLKRQMLFVSDSSKILTITLLIMSNKRLSLCMSLKFELSQRKCQYNGYNFVHANNVLRALFLWSSSLPRKSSKLNVFSKCIIKLRLLCDILTS